MRYAYIAMITCLLAVQADADIHHDSLQGRDLFEAQQYAEADDLYDRLLKETLTADQRRVVMLNRAAVSVAKKDWKQATERLRAIDMGDDPHPLIFELRNTYLAYALMQSSQGMDPKEAIATLEVVLQILDAVKQSDHPEDIEAWRSEAKHRLIEEQERLIEQRIETADAATLTSFLASGLDLLVHRLDSIGTAIGDEIPRDTIAAWAGILRNQTRVWEALEDRIERAEDPQKSQWLRRAQSQKKLASDLFEELRPLEGREETVLTAAALGIIAAEDRAEALLSERAQVSAIVDNLPSVLAGARKNSENKLGRWAYEELEQQVQQQQPDEGTVAEQQAFQWRQQQIESLLAALEKETGDAQDDLAFYLLLDQTEEELLGNTYTELAKLVDSEKGTAEQVEGYARILRTAARKLELRQQLLKDSNRKEQASWATRPLNQAQRRDRRRSPTDQLEDLSKATAESLRVWAPERLFLAQMDRLINATQAALPTPDRQAINQLSRIYREVKSTLASVKQKSDDRERFDQIEMLLERSESRRIYAQQQVNRDRFARMLLKDSMHWIESSRDMVMNQERSAVDLLTRAIGEQERARDLIQEMLTIPEARGEIDKLAPVMLTGQEHVKIVAEPFLVTLANEQQTKPLEPDIVDQVVDLFEEGSLAATGALTLLTVMPPEQQEAVVRQQETIDHWQEALELLKDDDGQDDQQQDDENDQQDNPDDQDQQDQEQEQQQQQQQSARPDRVLDLIQQMEQEDKALQQERKLPPTQGLRPW